MITWWIRISEIEDEQKQTAFFVGQEMQFFQLYLAINQLSPFQRQKVKLRYELHQTKNHQNQAVGHFTWESKDGLNLLESILVRLEMGVKNKIFDKKRMKEYRKLLENDISMNTEKDAGQQSNMLSNSYSPINKQEDQLEENIVPNQLDPDSFKSVKEKRVKERTKKERISIKNTKDKKRFSKFFTSFICKGKSFFQKISFFKRGTIIFKKWKLLLIISCSLFLIGTITYGASAYLNHQDSKVMKASYQDLKKQKEYKKMAKEYPKKFWSWEETQVENLKTETLMTVYEEYPDPAIAFDIAFLGKAYNKVIKMYQDYPEKLRMNNTRYSFLGFSYIQENQLEEAEKMVSKSNSKALYGQLALAYLRNGNDTKAEEMNKIAKDDDINVMIKNYQLVKATLDEVNKQLSKKGLSENIRTKLLENKKTLEDELKNIKNGEDD
ncbi:hypothetical protein D8X92_13640 [Listeria ivanovii]|uniref:Tetratricopeptide repeat protein n=1 Tax=Listeria ivanovii subsp. londoniensis TaxID=202752 RepID=A0ABS1G876_LISIV|nr:hypothetical protein [Listeria ivanovii]MBK1962930.1 hypothetical protein [Listeria ivanovii subsp. londoniensis]MBM5721732.1 hypothetical protein [Listeria ivanovii]